MLAWVSSTELEAALEWELHAMLGRVYYLRVTVSSALFRWVYGEIQTLYTYESYAPQSHNHPEAEAKTGIVHSPKQYKLVYIQSTQTRESRKKEDKGYGTGEVSVEDYGKNVDW